MMIGAPDVDQLIKATIKFGFVVGGVGHKVRIAFVAGDHDTVLFIAKRGGS